MKPIKSRVPILLISLALGNNNFFLKSKYTFPLGEDGNTLLMFIFIFTDERHVDFKVE